MKEKEEDDDEEKVERYTNSTYLPQIHLNTYNIYGLHLHGEVDAFSFFYAFDLDVEYNRVKMDMLNGTHHIYQHLFYSWAMKWAELYQKKMKDSYFAWNKTVEKYSNQKLKKKIIQIQEIASKQK